jgi:hypothetical protein
MNSFAHEAAHRVGLLLLVALVGLLVVSEPEAGASLSSNQPGSSRMVDLSNTVDGSSRLELRNDGSIVFHGDIVRKFEPAINAESQFDWPLAESLFFDQFSVASNGTIQLYCLDGCVRSLRQQSYTAQGSSVDAIVARASQYRDEVLGGVARVGLGTHDLKFAAQALRGTLAIAQRLGRYDEVRLWAEADGDLIASASDTAQSGIPRVSKADEFYAIAAIAAATRQDLDEAVRLLRKIDALTVRGKPSSLYAAQVHNELHGDFDIRERFARSWFDSHPDDRDVSLLSNVLTNSFIIAQNGSEARCRETLIYLADFDTRHAALLEKADAEMIESESKPGEVIPPDDWRRTQMSAQLLLTRVYLADRIDDPQAVDLARKFIELYEDHPGAPAVAQVIAERRKNR